MIEAGQVLQNRYLIQKQIGAGGMGTVYLATDQRLNSAVAIKETLFTDDELKRAFEREAQLLNSLRHSSLPRVIDYFTEGDAQFLVMEYIAGEDLSAILKAHSIFPVADVLRWADELLETLSYLHTQKMPVVHRDIKPQNLKLTDTGEIVLLDFGLAKGKPGDTSKLTKTNSVFGYSRSYAPLEQIQGTGTDPRSDLYSLTATLYHLLTGKPPTDALSRATAYVNGQEDPLVAPEKLNPQISAEVSQFLLKGLELNAGLRPQSAAEMRVQLQEMSANLSDVADKSPATNSAEKTAINVKPTPQFASTPKAVVASESDSRKSIEVRIPSTAAPILSADFADAEEKPVSSNVWKKYVGIAATILILGGGSAAWYATSQQTASQSNVNQDAPAAAVTVNKKSETTANSNVKTAANPATSSGNTASNSAVKIAESANSNKNAASKTALAEAAPSEKPASEVAEEPAEEIAPPIVVKSARPTAELIEEVRTEKKDKKDDEKPPDDNDDSEDNRRERRRIRERVNESSSRIRERRVRERRNNNQKLPTILGAPLDN